jgi:putative ABC transport system substrate-binding protein
MQRREFITLLGGAAAAWPLVVRAQQPDRIRRIGVLMGPSKDAEGQARAMAFRNGLQQLGWFEGQNTQFEYRWTGGQPNLIQKYAVELVTSQPDVIVCSSTPALIALRKESAGALSAATNLAGHTRGSV